MVRGDSFVQNLMVTRTEMKIFFYSERFINVKKKELPASFNPFLMSLNPILVGITIQAFQFGIHAYLVFVLLHPNL